MFGWVPLNFFCLRQRWALFGLSSIYKTDCLCLPMYMYVPMYLFHVRTAWPISAKFCTDLKINSLQNPTNPIPWPRGSPNSKTLADHTRKKLCFTKNVQVGDLISLNFSRAASIFIADGLYLLVPTCVFFHAQTANPTPWPWGTPNSKTLADHCRKNFALQKMH